jgi:hypothetical protein
MSVSGSCDEAAGEVAQPVANKRADTSAYFILDLYAQRLDPTSCSRVASGLLLP